MKSGRPTPFFRQLILVGGGHAHALLLRQVGMLRMSPSNPWEGIRLTLISPVSHTPYSGMIPGLVAGIYSFDESHIDLRTVAEFAGAEFIHDEVVGLDLQRKKVLSQGHPPLAFDAISLNIGSTPSPYGVSAVSGVPNLPLIPIRPIPQFLHTWQEIIHQVEHLERPLKIGLVGGGVGGVELAFNMEKRLRPWGKITLFFHDHHDQHDQYDHQDHQSQQILSKHSRALRRQVLQQFSQRGIELLPSGRIDEGKCDYLFGATHAQAPQWPKQSGLQVDQEGFIAVAASLQSLSHPFLFAAGDIAAVEGQRREKAGVYAVRQAKPLEQNLLRYLNGETLRPMKLQKNHLILIGTGEQKALAARGPYTFPTSSVISSMIWKLKDSIDRKFMRMFSQYPGSPVEGQMRCLGCAAKVGAPILKSVLARAFPIDEEIQPDCHLQSRPPIQLMMGLRERGDSSLLNWNQLPLVQSLDFFPAPLSDPFLVGRITVNHCLSDLWAMGATAHSVHCLVVLPLAAPNCQEEIFFQTMMGVKFELKKQKVILIGGHTSEGQEGQVLSIGLLGNGFLSPGPQGMRKQGMKKGDQLILTKALGSGTLLAALRSLQVRGSWIDELIESMLLSNKLAGEIFLQHHHGHLGHLSHGVTACTDVTGFGLLGHLLEMMSSHGDSDGDHNADHVENLGVTIELAALPFFLGSKMTVQKGILSSLHPANMSSTQNLIIPPSQQVSDHPYYPLLFDPQTSGGLLATVSKEKVQTILHSLHQAGYVNARLIGEVREIDRTEKRKILLQGNFLL